MTFNIGFYAYATIGHTQADQLYPPANFVCGGVYCFHVVRPCVRPSVCPSVTFCFLNILKSHCWIFIKPCKHVHICKTNTFPIYIYNVDTLNICMKEFVPEKIIFDKMTAVRT